MNAPIIWCERLSALFAVYMHVGWLNRQIQRACLQLTQLSLSNKCLNFPSPYPNAQHTPLHHALSSRVLAALIAPISLLKNTQHNWVAYVSANPGHKIWAIITLICHKVLQKAKAIQSAPEGYSISRCVGADQREGQRHKHANEASCVEDGVDVAGHRSTCSSNRSIHCSAQLEPDRTLQGSGYPKPPKPL